jgi:hypothetical protein
MPDNTATFPFLPSPRHPAEPLPCPRRGHTAAVCSKLRPQGSGVCAKCAKRGLSMGHSLGWRKVNINRGAMAMAWPHPPELLAALKDGSKHGTCKPVRDARLPRIRALSEQLQCVVCATSSVDGMLRASGPPHSARTNQLDCPPPRPPCRLASACPFTRLSVDIICAARDGSLVFPQSTRA